MANISLGHSGEFAVLETSLRPHDGWIGSGLEALARGPGDRFMDKLGANRMVADSIGWTFVALSWRAVAAAKDS